MNPLKRWWRSAPTDPTYHPVQPEVLVVEDDDDQRDLICGLLRMQRAIVSRAGNIAGALEILAGSSRFQLAFVDLGLPDGQGWEIVRLVKERRRMTHVIVVTGDVGRVPMALEWGYVGVILKPYSSNSIREVFAKHRLLPFGD